MLQLRRIRSFEKNGQTKTYDAPFDPDILIESHEELFTNLDKYIAMIPDYERYNCHYTQGHTQGGSKRGSGSFERQSLVVFDVDAISFSKSKEENKKYVDIFFATTKCDREKTLVILSGHGLHFVTQIEAWTDKSFFKSYGQSYSDLCKELEYQYRTAGLVFKELDRAVFAPNKMLRLPNTWNVKEGKPKKLCKILSGRLATQNNFLEKKTTKKEKGSKAQTKLEESKTSKHYPKLDSMAIEAGCDFLQFCKKDPAKVNEDQWYASLSILGRLENGVEKAQEYSRGHPGYSPEETATKLEHAMKSGPRTCEDIGKRWRGCGDCNHWGKVKSPVGIRAEETIASKEDHFYYTDENGKKVPAYEDLLKYFNQCKPHKVNVENGNIQAFDGKKYESFFELQVKGFAAQHFKPQPFEFVITEFCKRVKRFNHVTPNFFDVESGLINFDNGILEIKTGQLHPHSPDYGFQYVLPYPYDPKAECPVFDAMMDRITCQDLSLKQLLLEFAAYCICDRTYKHHKAMILIGEGSNGKSTFLDVIKELVGHQNFSAIGIKEMEDHGKRAMLEGKLVNISDEMPNMNMSDTDTFKKMMGGNITIKKLWENSTTIRCTTKLMFAANEIPSTFDHSKGFRRRIILAPFDASFEGKNMDLGILDKIKKELPGIFNRVLDAYQDLEARGSFVYCARSEGELASYMEENDVVGTFIKQHYDWTDSWDKIDTGILLGELTKDFLEYANSVNENTRWVDKRRMGLAIKRAIPNCEKRKKRIITPCGKKETLYRGVSKINFKDLIYKNGNGADHLDSRADFGNLDAILEA